MSWQEGIAVTVVLLGLGAGAFLVAQRPSFLIEFGARLGKALLPLAWRYVSKRMSPEEEAAWRQAQRRGQGDERTTERWRRIGPNFERLARSVDPEYTDARKNGVEGHSG